MVPKHDITHMRGDTLQFNLTLTDTENVYVSSIYFSVKRKEKDEDYILQKSIGDGIIQMEPYKYHVRLAPSDTAYVPSGKYVYDIQVGLGNDIYTVVKGAFTLLQDVTEEVE